MLRGPNWSYIHIPKCGGTALRKYLDGFEYGDFMPLGVSCAVRSNLHRIPRRRPSGRIFAVVRHPAAWLRSFWLDQSPARIKVNRYLHKYWADDLDEFIYNICAQCPGYVTKLYKAHLRYRSIKIFRLEDGLDPVFAWAGLSVKNIPHINASPKLPILSSQSFEFIEKTESMAIRRFGYEVTA